MDLEPQNPLSDNLVKPASRYRIIWIFLTIAILGIAALLISLPFLPPSANADADLHATRLILRGQIEMSRNDLAAAKASFEEASRVAPNLAAPWEYLASIAQMQNRLDDAIALYKKSIAIDPGTMPNHYNLACIYLQLGRLNDAQEEATASLAKSPKVQYLLLNAELSERLHLDPAEIVHRFLLVVQSAPGQASFLTPKELASTPTISAHWSSAVNRLLALKDVRGLAYTASVYTDPKNRPDVVSLAADVLKRAGTPGILLLLLDDDSPSTRAAGLAALEKFTSSKFDFNPDAGPQVRSVQLNALRSNPVIHNPQTPVNPVNPKE